MSDPLKDLLNSISSLTEAEARKIMTESFVQPKPPDVAEEVVSDAEKKRSSYEEILKYMAKHHLAFNSETRNMRVVEFGNNGIMNLSWDALNPVYNDKLDPTCEGWHVVWREVGEEEDARVIGAARWPLAEAVDGPDAAWVFVDYLIDDEAGEPLAIKFDTEAIYAKIGSKWRSMNKDYPEVER